MKKNDILQKIKVHNKINLKWQKKPDWFKILIKTIIVSPLF